MIDSDTPDAPPAADSDSRSAEEAAFTPVSSKSHHVAALYFYLELDALIDCAHAVATDFFARPQLYTALGEPLAPRLAELYARYGTDERIPSSAQRNLIYRSVFGRAAESGASAGDGDFGRLSADLIAAAGAFAERAYDTGEVMLRERVRSAHRPLRDYLDGLGGDSLAWSSEEALAGITRDRAYPILRNAGVCAVFGISTPPRAEWPYVPDANGDKLIEEVTKQLSGDQALPRLTREGISNRQRAALRGAEALVSVLAFNEEGSDDHLTLLITRCYTWGAALRGLAAAPSSRPLPLAPEG